MFISIPYFLGISVKVTFFNIFKSFLTIKMWIVIVKKVDKIKLALLTKQ